MSDHAAEPSPLPCPECGYDVGAAGPPRCPECGLVLTDDVKQRAAVRRKLFAERPRRLRRALLIQGSGVLACGLGVFGLEALRVGGEPGNGVWAAALCSAACAVSWCAEAVAVWATPAGHRAAVAAMWERRVGWLLGPWLLVPPATVAFGVVVSATSVAGLGRPGVETPGFVLLGVWVLAVAITAGEWAGCWRRDAAAAGLPPAGRRARFLAALAAGLASGLLGLLGLFAGMIGAAAVVYQWRH